MKRLQQPSIKMPLHTSEAEMRSNVNVTAAVLARSGVKCEWPGAKFMLVPKGPQITSRRCIAFSLLPLRLNQRDVTLIKVFYYTFHNSMAAHEKGSKIVRIMLIEKYEQLQEEATILYRGNADGQVLGQLQFKMADTQSRRTLVDSCYWERQDSVPLKPVWNGYGLLGYWMWWKTALFKVSVVIMVVY